jgi:hypothetical protein
MECQGVAPCDHLAKSAISSFTVFAAKFHTVVSSASICQPTNIYPLLKGFLGLTISAPEAT